MVHNQNPGRRRLRLVRRNTLFTKRSQTVNRQRDRAQGGGIDVPGRFAKFLKQSFQRVRQAGNMGHARNAGVAGQSMNATI